MQITIDRTEPDSGGEQRTPREQIEPVFTEDDEVEPDLAGDASSSEGFAGSSSPDPGSPTTWEVQILAMKEFIGGAEALDSQAAGEQAGGSDEQGGVYGAFFNHGVVKIGEGDDDGDLNSSNFDRKVGAIRVRSQEGGLVPLPYGGTRIMPTIRYLDQHYLGEFSKYPDGTPRPVAQRPVRARMVFTDGAMDDYAAFGARLEEDHSESWPREEWFIAILGYGDAHDRTLKLYQKLAGKHKNLHVYSFDGVKNGKEIAEDMAVAVLATKA